MKRACFLLELREGTEDRYDQLHAQMSDEVRKALRDAGLRNYSLFRSGTMVIGYVEAEPDFATSMASQVASPAFRDWAKGLDGVFVEISKGVARLVEVEEIWHVD
jgi:L-rhamnose mutarotase